MKSSFQSLLILLALISSYVEFWMHKTILVSYSHSLSNNLLDEKNALPTVPLSEMRPGVVVLGMHRSGTSMTTGLLVQGSLYDAGENLIPPRQANAKGYFEDWNVVRQNDLFLAAQGASIYGNYGFQDILKYRSMTKSRTELDDPGQQALAFLNHHVPTARGWYPDVPWIQKDPRMCITLQDWLPLLEYRPAVLFIYRNPLESALSMRERDKTGLARGLGLWLLYNSLGIRNSKGLCRVVTNNDDVLVDPSDELTRINRELVHRCGVLAPPRMTPPESVITDFIDFGMQKSKVKAFPVCPFDENKPIPVVRLDSYRAVRLYKRAMKLFCDMESGRAFEDNYDDWPDAFLLSNL